MVVWNRVMIGIFLLNVVFSCVFSCISSSEWLL